MTLNASGYGSSSMRTHEENTADILIAQRQPDTPEARDAFGRVIEAYSVSLYAMSLERMRDPLAAQELAQDVAVHAMRKLPQLRDPRCFAGWLRMITRRMAVNALTRRGKLFQAEEGVLDEAPSSEGEPSEGVLREEREAVLRKALAQLKELDRQTLEAFYFRGRSLKEMRREFDAPVGTIKRRLHVARQRLRELMKGTDFDDTLSAEQQRASA